MSYKVFDICMGNDRPCKKEDCEFYEGHLCTKYLMLSCLKRDVYE